MGELFSGENLLPTMLGLASFFVVVGIWMSMIDDTSSDRRARMLERRRADLRSEMAQNRSTARAAEATAMAKDVVERFKLLPAENVRKTMLELAQAGYRTRDAVFIYTFLRLAMPLLGWALGFFLFYVLRVWDTSANNLLMGTLCSGIALGLAPSITLRNITERRLKAMSKSLPDALDLFVICAEAGLSLDATFERVANEIAEAHTDLADEFGLTAVELGFMPDRSKALQGLVDRCSLPGVRSLVSTLIQTERYGTPLAVSMRVLSAEMRNERMMKAEEKAARLPAIMTVPMILFILPPLFVVLIGPAMLRVSDAL